MEKRYKIIYGFNAYVFKEGKFSNWDLGHSIHLCIIPRGSEYCIDIYGEEIIANKMIVFSNRWKYIEYRIKKLFGI